MISCSFFDKPVKGFAEGRVFHGFVYLPDKLFFRRFFRFHNIHNKSLPNRIFKIIVRRLLA